MMKNPRPNFIILGAVKAGTTSLFEYLRQHPDVFMPSFKEPGFFACPEVSSISSIEDYEALFADSRGETALGEASVAYLFDHTTPGRILETLGPDVKLVVSLRNPLDMTYSQWGHRVRVGGEDLPFLKALDAEASRMDDPEFAAKCYGWVYNYAYVARATYTPQLQRYIDCFGRSQIHIMLFEDFFEDPLRGYQGLCEFLGVDHSFEPEFRIHNPAGISRSPLLHRVVNRSYAAKDVAKVLLPKALRLALKRKANIANRKALALPDLCQADRVRLWPRFAKDVVALEKLLGLSLQKRWSPNPQSAASQ